MDYQWIVSQIHSKGKQKEMLDVLLSYIPHLSKDDQAKLEHCLEKIAYTITPEQAHHIVQTMVPYGEHWKMSEVKQFIATKGIDVDQTLHYYLAMNMVYNDYHGTADKFGLKDSVDFYFCLAKEFIDDADGVPFKVEKYFEM